VNEARKPPACKARAVYARRAPVCRARTESHKACEGLRGVHVKQSGLMWRARD